MFAARAMKKAEVRCKGTKQVEVADQEVLPLTSHPLQLLYLQVRTCSLRLEPGQAGGEAGGAARRSRGNVRGRPLVGDNQTTDIHRW